MRNHTTIRTALAALAVAVTAPAVAAGAQAGAAQAPEVGAQKTLTAGKVAPVTIPGTGLKKGMKLKSGQKLVFRSIALGDSKTVRFTLSCGTAGSKLKGLGYAEGGKARFNLDGGSNYVGKRSVKLRADAPKDVTDAHGTMYALCAR